jgi:hypothetical protein
VKHAAQVNDIYVVYLLDRTETRKAERVTIESKT